MVKPIIDRMHQVGANDTTINIFLIYLMSFMFLIGLGLMAIIVLDVAVRNVQPPPWVIGSFTAIIGITTTLLAVNHGVQSISNVQSKTVMEQQQTTKPIIEAASQTSVINAQTIQQVLAAMAILNQTNATNPIVPVAQETQQVVQENTDATKENTKITLMETMNRAGNSVTTNREESS